ncbi:hypothetical protein Taro_027562 [Colocasia esculenta]|uniref:DDE Tnp4 domain-containing protein n=1 Tax=Colocasia esculenta TaxID=4460 RepID=A0A843VMV2_COLES|nr:hypothetical protein [Colocasia esculenta]
MRVLRWALESGGFKIPEGKYFLVDAGYANTPEFLAPYRGIRYHLSEYNSSRRTRLRYRSKKDLFNHRHAQLRNVVKRAFGVLKARFTILVKRRNYPIKTQARIAMAYCVLHNFIRMEGGLDYIFRRGQCDEVVEGDEDVHVDDHVHRTEAARGDRFRNELATRLWIQHTARGAIAHEDSGDLQDDGCTNNSSVDQHMVLFFVGAAGGEWFLWYGRYNYTMVVNGFFRRVHTMIEWHFTAVDSYCTLLVFQNHDLNRKALSVDKRLLVVDRQSSAVDNYCSI